jgi:hypothetical protein
MLVAMAGDQDGRVAHIFLRGFNTAFQIDGPEALSGSSPPISEEKTGSPSTRGTQPQTKRPAVSISAET